MTSVKDIETVELVDGSDLSIDERKEFDYMDWPAIDAGHESETFFKYKGTVYDYGTVQPNDPVNGVSNTDGIRWNGIITDTYFSGLVIHNCDEPEEIKVGLYFA